MANILNGIRFGSVLLALLLGASVLPLVSAESGPPPPLPTEKVVIDTAKGPKTFTLEIAADDASQERGLMFRTHLAPNAGMLFDFRRIVMTAFWMKNTPLPLDIIFVRPDGSISTIAANAVPYSLAPIPSAEPVRAVIEIGGGVSRKLGIAPGDHVRAPIFPK